VLYIGENNEQVTAANKAMEESKQKHPKIAEALEKNHKTLTKMLDENYELEKNGFNISILKKI
jgi:hypothetical protein